MNIIDFIEKYIENNIAQPHTLVHHLDTRNLLLMLNSDISIEAQVAALTHDIERQSESRLPDPEDFSDNNYLISHGEASAKIVVELLKKEGFNLDYEKLSELITQHEVGGDPEADLIRDADSISFLKNTTEGFLKKFDKEKCREKFDFMFDRIGDVRAKEIAREYYNKALELLK